jgi:hypothetical protein
VWPWPCCGEGLRAAGDRIVHVDLDAHQGTSTA